jgi:hypothetical protein
MIGAILAKCLGRSGEADHVLETGMRRFPENLDIAMECAGSPVAAGDWDKSFRRWTELALRFPDNSRISDARGDAELHIQINCNLGAGAACDFCATSCWKILLRDRRSSFINIPGF